MVGVRFSSGELIGKEHSIVAELAKGGVLLDESGGGMRGKDSLIGELVREVALAGRREGARCAGGGRRRRGTEESVSAGAFVHRFAGRELGLGVPEAGETIFIVLAVFAVIDAVPEGAINLAEVFSGLLRAGELVPARVTARGAGRALHGSEVGKVHEFSWVAVVRFEDAVLELQDKSLDLGSVVLVVL